MCDHTGVTFSFLRSYDVSPEGVSGVSSEWFSAPFYGDGVSIREVGSFPPLLNANFFPPPAMIMESPPTLIGPHENPNKLEPVFNGCTWPSSV